MPFLRLKYACRYEKAAQCVEKAVRRIAEQRVAPQENAKIERKVRLTDER